MMPLKKMKLWPDKGYWSSYIKKLISFTISLKVLFFLTATGLLVHDYITGTNWVSAIGIILGARLGNQLMFEYKKANSTISDNTISEETGV